SLAMLPIFVVDRHGCDIEVFRSVEEAEGHLEPIDVRNREFEVYDAAGQELSVVTDGNRTRISRDGRVAREALTDRLVRFLRAADIQVPSPSDWPTFVESSAAAIERWRPRRFTWRRRGTAT